MKHNRADFSSLLHHLSDEKQSTLPVVGLLVSRVLLVFGKQFWRIKAHFEGELK